MSASSDKIQKLLVSWVNTVFQLDRLERLASTSIFIRVAYSALIGNINYSIFHESIDPGAAIVIANIGYPFTLAGRKAAISESFRHFSNMLNDFLTTANVARIMGSMDFIGDIASAALRGQRTTQRVTVPKAKA